MRTQCRFSLTLQDRILYLTFAINNAKSQMPAAATRDAVAQFISAQEEKRDVAQIQVEIYVAIEQAVDISDEFKHSAMEQLDSGLFDVNVVSWR
jgi:nuclear pore complex protein Nup155